MAIRSYRLTGRLAVAAVFVLTALPCLAESGFVSLFDGQSLDGWHSWRPEAAKGEWVVEDGCLTTKGRPRELATDKVYGDFELRFEWKIAPGGNSGIIYRTEKGYHPPTSGPEFQLLDDVARGDILIPERSNGAAYGIYAPTLKPAARPAGEWNTGRIVAKGDHIEHWLNGRKILEYELHTADWQARVAKSKFARHPQYGAASKGHIILQDHGAPVHFRNLEIREIQ